MNISMFFDLVTTFGALFLIILSAFLFIAIYSKNEKLVKITDFFHKHSLKLITAESFMAIVGSLIYSEIFKFEACVLCWWQRIFIYPVFIIALVALIKKDKNPFQYINPLMWIALLISLYHNYLIAFSGDSLSGGEDSFFCTDAIAGACSDRYVEILSVIDIPFMALSIILFILILSAISTKKLKNN